MIANIIQKLVSALLYQHLRSYHLWSFLLLGFLPFYGVAWFGWSPALVLLGFFADRIIGLLFMYLTEVVMLRRTAGLQLPVFATATAVFAVTGYMLLQFGVLAYMFSGISEEGGELTELLQIIIVVAILYTIQWIFYLRMVDSSRWQPTFFMSAIKQVFLGAGIYMLALAIGIFSVGLLRQTFLASFFTNGYGVMIFVMVSLRMLADWRSINKSLPAEGSSAE